MRNIICKKCGRVLFKNTKYKDYCLEGYEPDQGLCPGCNATESVITRLRAGGTISAVECSRLPNLLLFNPTGSNDEEETYGLEFKHIIQDHVREAFGRAVPHFKANQL